MAPSLAAQVDRKCSGPGLIRRGWAIPVRPTLSPWAPIQTRSVTEGSLRPPPPSRRPRTRLHSAAVPRGRVVGATGGRRDGGSQTAMAAPL